MSKTIIVVVIIIAVAIIIGGGFYVLKDDNGTYLGNSSDNNSIKDCGEINYFDEDTMETDEYKCFQDNMNKCIPAKILLDKSHDNKIILTEIIGLRNDICYWKTTNMESPFEEELFCEKLDENGNYTKSINCPDTE